MGTTNVSFDQGTADAQQRFAQRQQMAEANRVAGRDAYVALQKNVLDNPNNDPNDPALNDIKDPAAKQAEIDRRTAARQSATSNIAGAYQPHEAGSLVKVLSGLIHGKPAPPNPAAAVAAQPSTPPIDPNATPPAPVVKDMLGIPISDSDVAAAHQEPLHPMAASHPILDRFKEGLDALGNHLSAAASGAHSAQPAYDTSNLAAGYASPISTARDTAELQAEHAQKLANIKGQFGVTQAEVRGGAVRGVAGHPLALQSAQNLADNGEIFIDKNTGKPLDLDDVQTAVPGAQLTPYYQGARLLGYEVSDQNGHVITADNVKKVVGLGGKQLPGSANLGAATVPKDVSSASRDQYGNVTTTQRRTAPETPTQPVSSAAPTIPGQTPTPPNVVPGAPELAAINAGIQANKGKAGAPSRKVAAGASPSQPVSSAAPKGPAILDANDQIPASAAANPQIRQFAQDLLDDRDVAQIPAKARAAAEQVARQFGWSQGAFTPREQRAINLTSDFLDKFASSPSLKILDSPILRAEAVTALHHSEGLGGQQLQAFTSRLEDPAVAEFVRLYNANVNNVTGASSTIRPGRPTEALVKRLGTELPTVLQAKDSTDAKERIKLLQSAIKDAQKSSRLKGVSPSSSAPQSLTDRLNEALGK